MKKEGPLENEINKSVVTKLKMGKYNDIINLEHHVSKNHKQMSIYDRSAQFAPFAALTGYDESISEAGRMVDSKINLSDDKIEEISQVLMLLYQKNKEQVNVRITYFKEDKTKKGGQYLTTTSIVKKIVPEEKKIVLINKVQIEFKNIVGISII